MYKIDDINFMVSLYCPGECVNCNIWQYEKGEITKDEVDLEVFETMLRSDALKGLKYVDLTAGESQLSSKYVDVVRLIAHYFPEAMIHTNISGWYPKKHFEVTQACLEYVKPEKFRIDVSLDGNEENYQKVRLVKEGFAKVMQSIALLKTLPIILRTTMIVYKENYKDIPWLVNFAKDNGLGYFIGYARNASLLNNVDHNFDYTPQQLQEIEALLTSVKWLTPRRQPNWLWAKSIYQKHIPEFECFMGEQAIVIDPQGNVFPCNDLLPQLNMGNIKTFQGDLDALLNSEQALSVIKKVQQKECQPCGMLCAHKIEFPWGKQTGLLE